MLGGYNLGSSFDLQDEEPIHGSGPNLMHRGRLLYTCTSTISHVKMGDYLVVGCSNGDIYTFEGINSEPNLHQAGSALTALTICNKRIYFSTVSDGKVFYLDGKERCTVFDISPKRVTALLAHDQSLLFVGSSDNTVTGYYILDGNVLDKVILKGHTNWVTCMALEGGLLATASLDRSIRLWSLSDSQSQGLQELVQTKNFLKTRDRTIYFNQNALLLGHESGVNSVAFTDDGLIISAGSDRSVIIWTKDGLVQAQYGESGAGQLGSSVGADHSVGFTWACISKSGVIFAGQSSGTIQRIDGLPITGHAGSVESLDWLADDLLITASADQTTRIWWLNGDGLVELSRSQIHGYDMNAVVATEENSFASAGDEKVIRYFKATEGGVRRLEAARANQRSFVSTSSASLPALGLTSRVAEEQSAGETFQTIPSEADLAQRTLWPESGKLYGHGAEVFRLAWNPREHLLASACKATRSEDAAIRMWCGDVCEAVLIGPNLTVTSLSFSPSGSLLLATSRDRCIYVYQGTELKLDIKEAHSRIIWAGAWLDENRFVTCSRDGSLKLWRVQGSLIAEYQAGDALTTVATHKGLIYTGSEHGTLSTLDESLNVLHSTRLCAGPINGIKARNDLMAVASGDHSLHLLSTKK